MTARRLAPRSAPTRIGTNQPLNRGVKVKSPHFYSDPLVEERQRLMPDAIIRSLCLFTDRLDDAETSRLERLATRLEETGFVVQTRRVCVTGHGATEVEAAYGDDQRFLSVGQLDRAGLAEQFDALLAADNVACNLAIDDAITADDVAWLFRLVAEQPGQTFGFAYTFRNATGSPFFPSATWAGNGFAIGLQPTDLAAGCDTVEAWLARLRDAWNALDSVLGDEPDYLGIDGSIAPLWDEPGSLVGHVRRWAGSFEQAVTSDLFLRITAFLKHDNPRPVGLNGLMLPCLEDRPLAGEYSQGRFTIERNLFLALHCGLGIDTYPLGVDESPARVLEILRLVQGLAERHAKPLSVRFVSDGRARIGERTGFGNRYLHDVVVRPL